VGEEGTEGYPTYAVLGVLGWQDKKVVALAKARTWEEDRREYGSDRRSTHNIRLGYLEIILQEVILREVIVEGDYPGVVFQRLVSKSPDKNSLM